MKRRATFAAALSAILIITLLLSGCGAKEDILSEYIDLVSEKPTAESTEAAEKYLDKHLQDVDSQDADYMIQLLADFKYRYDNDMDYRKFAEKYKASMNVALYDFYNLKADEQEDPITEGGKTENRCETAIERAVSMENFIKQNKELLQGESYAPAKEDSTWLYEYYINFMFTGSSENPVFSRETGEFSEEAQNSYAKTAGRNGDTVTAWAVNEFFAYLESVDYKLDYKDTVESKIYYDTCAYIESEAGKRI